MKSRISAGSSELLNRIKPKSEFGRNILTLMSGATVAQAIPIAISPILTRLYTPEDFGVFALFIALLSVFGSVASGRYEQALLLPKKEEDAINLMALGFIITLLLSTFLLLILLLLHDTIVSLLNNTHIGAWLYFLPLAILFTGLFNVLSYFNNRKKHYADLRNAAIAKSFAGAVVQIAVGWIKSGAAGLIIGQMASLLAANAKLLKNTLADSTFFDRLSRVRIIALAKKYRDFPKFQGPHAILNSFSSQMPIYFFSAFFTSGVVGFFALSIRIVFLPLSIISSSAAKVFNEKAARSLGGQENLHFLTRNVLTSTVKKTLLPFAVIVLFAPDIFAFVFGTPWREAGVYTQILSPWLYMVFVVSMVAYIPNLYNQQKRALKLEIIYTLLRLISLATGIIFHSVYIAIALFSLSGFVMLAYNLGWMLSLTKGEH
jgi:O-antigen/teichoic acid export membrane protein